MIPYHFGNNLKKLNFDLNTGIIDRDPTKSMRWDFGLVFHELGHAIDLCLRGQEQRVLLPTFGWEFNRSYEKGISSPITVIQRELMAEIFNKIGHRYFEVGSLGNCSLISTFSISRLHLATIEERIIFCDRVDSLSVSKKYEAKFHKGLDLLRKFMAKNAIDERAIRI